MVLQAATKIRQLDSADRTSDAPVLLWMQFFFARIHEHAVAVNVSLIVNWFIRLPPVVEGNRIGPNVLPPLADLLPVVLPMDAVPVEVGVDPVLEASPDGRAWICCRGVNHYGPRRGPAPVIDPILMTTPALLVSTLNVIAERSRVPDIYRAIELFHVMFGHEGEERFSWSGIRVNVVGQSA